ncbi:aminoglycoside phosphotransferase family protein [Streptomyces acidiscabies]|uniref:aminoglycoside phosphotransferase family protein n=1 Tax=Streptomyces acidiscabies TaxID=42234 RepID=UPI000950BF4D|nr:aminoglycoside phosphotransferase family protein [Streptomyces acidiscabies]
MTRSVQPVIIPPSPLSPLETWIESVLGPVELYPVLDHYSWHAIRPDGRRYIVKRATSLRSFQREIYAHSCVLGALDAASVPCLVAASHPRLTLITTALPGIPVTRTRLLPDTYIHTYRSAGTLLASLHHALQPAPRALAAALTALRETADRADRILTLMQPSPLSPDERAFAADRIAHLREAEVNEIGFIHGAFHEDSWVRSTTTRRLALTDFSASRFAPVVYDLIHIACRWINHGHLRTAFFQGYGRRLSTCERRTLVSLVTLHCATQLALNPTGRAARAEHRVLTRLSDGAHL